MFQSTPKSELDHRMTRLRRRLDEREPGWRAAIVTRKPSLFYLTGAVPDGMLYLPRETDATLFVRRGYSRAMEESAFSRIRPMRSFRDAAERIGSRPQEVLVEKDGLTLSLLELLNKHFHFERIDDIAPHLSAVRAVKSRYEIERVRRAGAIQAEILERIVPTLLREGMTEAELAAEILAAFLKRGSLGLIRVNQPEMELLLGCVCFGDSSLLSNGFSGPDGLLGMHTTLQSMGSPGRRLAKGDIVFVDAGCNFEGYHTDKTVVYGFGADPPDEVLAAHERCLAIQADSSARLRPGERPSAIYESVVAGMDAAFFENFMGFGEQHVPFLGHGCGLHVAEPPIIAKGFDEPLEENMVIALEPKKGIPGIGMVGTENTFLVTPEGGLRLTGGEGALVVCRGAAG